MMDGRNEDVTTTKNTFLFQFILVPMCRSCTVLNEPPQRVLGILRRLSPSAPDLVFGFV